MDEPIALERHGQIAVIALNRPNNGNALDPTASRELQAAAIRCDADPDIAAVVLTGRGKLFCGGGDTRFFPTAGADRHRLLTETVISLNGALTRLLRMAKPLVVAVNGPAAGAGLGLAMAGDEVLAAPGATFSTAYAAIGISPDVGVSWMLPRLVGLRRAQNLLYSNRRVPAEEAAHIGLISRVVPLETLLEDALAQAAQLARIAPRAFSDTRRLLLQSSGASLEEHLEDEARAMLENAKRAAGEL
jgi:2-(1,2-epoxy-1,2-dihydrophenyl)acetyl-CoA isomerase